MNEIKKIKRYIHRTGVPRSSCVRYDMFSDEWFALCNMAAEKPVEAIITAFDYGRAKGYRAAKAEARREKAGASNE